MSHRHRTLFSAALVVAALIGVGIVAPARPGPAVVVETADPARAVSPGGGNMSREPAATRAINGFEILALEQDQVYWPDDGRARQTAFAMARGATFDPKLAAEILAANGALLARFDRCLASPRFECPRLERPMEGLGVGWNALANLVSVRAFAHASAGRFDAAFDEAMKVVRYGHRVERAGGSLIHWITGSTLKTVGSGCLHSLAQLGLPTTAVLRRIVAELDGLRSDRDGLRRALEWGLTYESRRIDDLAAGRVEPEELWMFDAGELPIDWRTAHFDATATQRLLARAYETTWEAIELTFDPEGLRQRLAALTGEDGAVMSSGNDVGVRLVRDNAIEGLHLLLERPCKADVYIDAVRTVLVLLDWRAREGHLPADLTALRGAAFPSVPVDPFDGQPLRYSRDEEIVYSVGRDRADAGGSAAKGAARARQDADEPTFKIRF